MFAAAVAEAHASRARRSTPSSPRRCGSRRTAREARSRRSSTRPRTLDGWRDGGLAALRAAFAPFDSVGEPYAQPAQNARIPSRLHSIEELPVALGLLVATGGDYTETVLGGVNYGRDSDSIASMGGALAGALGSPVPREWVEEIGDREQDRPRGAGARDGRGRPGDRRARRAPSRAAVARDSRELDRGAA